MMQGAKTIMDNCVSLKAGEVVLIVTDMMQENIAKVLAAAATERGAEVIVSVMKPRKKAGEEPPKLIAESMKHADVVLIPVSYSVTHTYAVKEAAQMGYVCKIGAECEFYLFETDEKGNLYVRAQVDHLEQDLQRKRQRQGRQKVKPFADT